jgi:hypothetical protein
LGNSVVAVEDKHEVMLEGMVGEVVVVGDAGGLRLVLPMAMAAAEAERRVSGSLSV